MTHKGLIAGVLTDHLFVGFPLRSLHLRESVRAFVYSSLGHRFLSCSPQYPQHMIVQGCQEMLNKHLWSAFVLTSLELLAKESPWCKLISIGDTAQAKWSDSLGSHLSGVTCFYLNPRTSLSAFCCKDWEASFSWWSPRYFTHQSSVKVPTW